MGKLELLSESHVAGLKGIYDKHINGMEKEVWKEIQRHKEKYGGAVRGKKGKFFEEFTELLFRFSWEELGENPTRLTFSKKKERLYHNTDKSKRLSQGIGVDLHAYIDKKIAVAIECKAYTDASMYKRALMDFFLIKKINQDIKCVITELESSINGASKDTLNSYFPDSVPVIITLLSGKRKSQKPIHQKKHKKVLSDESIKLAIETCKGLLQCQTI